jgi:DNA mismatch repair protein MutS2
MHRDLGLEARPQRARDGEAPQPIAAGDRVHVTSWEQDGTVLEDLGESALVQIGSMRMTVPKSDLRRRGGPSPRRERPATSPTLEAASKAQTEIDVRGKRFVEAEPLVERWHRPARQRPPAIPQGASLRPERPLRQRGRGRRRCHHF